MQSKYSYCCGSDGNRQRSTDNTRDVYVSVSQNTDAKEI